MQTRELFWQLSPLAVQIFYGLGVAAMIAFTVGLAIHIRKYRHGAAHHRPFDWRAGLRRMAADMLTHRTLARRDRFAGAAHRLIFYGFSTLFLGTAIVTVDYDIVRPLSGRTFWTGWFYLAFSLAMDIAGLALIVGLLMMMVRRAAFGLTKLSYIRDYCGDTTERPAARSWRIEDWVFLSSLLLIALSGFLQEAVRLIIESPPLGDLSPVGIALAKALTALGIDIQSATRIRELNWWLHGVLALTFVWSVAWSKGKHIVAALGSLTVRDPQNVNRLPPALIEQPVGVSVVDEFSWRDLLHLDACTKCGRCHDACPARASGYPLSPRDFILDLRRHAEDRSDQARAASLLDIIPASTLWACRSCGACAEICPVGIEHPVKIVKMRRALVEQGEMDPVLRGVLETIADSGNSFGESARKRGSWTKDLAFPVKDARKEPVEALWFVGDFASFDPRSQSVSRTVAALLKAAGLDFGLLYDGERNAGNDIRRVGEEGLYESLSEQNIQQINQSNFDWVFTTDPHSFNTLKNEYPDMGRSMTVRHYSSVLADMLEDGRLTVKKPLARRVTLHDPCHLGRFNGEYDAPRRVLRAIGCEIVEMPRCRDNSFCCGAGGGRIWTPDPPGTEKPAHSRMHEAAALGGIDTFVTCCPKDLTMFEDARKTSGHEDSFAVTDLAELVAEAVDLKALDPAEIPKLLDRITDAVAQRVADRIIPDLVARLNSALPAPTALPAGPAMLDAPAEIALEAPTNPILARGDSDWQITPLRPAHISPYDKPDKDTFRILVAVKHVAKLSDDFRFSDDGRDVSAEDVEFQLNEWDETALEEAVQLIEKMGSGEVIVVTIGPDDAETSIRKALAKGAHRAVRLWQDKGTAPSDPFTVASLLAGVAIAEEADLIFTGVQSSDFANGAAAAATAAILGWAHAAVAVSVTRDSSTHLTIERELEGGLRHASRMPFPAVLSIQAGANTPRYATMRMIKEARSKPLTVASDITFTSRETAATITTMVAPAVGQAAMIEGTPADIASTVATLIREKKGL